jgi:aminopeptidase
MNGFEQELKAFARVAVRIGVNLQKGQGLGISAPPEASHFVHLVTEEAYKAGAKDVHLEWFDEETLRLRLKYAPLDALKQVPAWKFYARNESVKDNYAALNIYGSNPDLLEEVDGARTAAYMTSVGKGSTPFREYMMNNRIQWSIVAYPTAGWAKKVFPGKPIDEAQKLLMKEILRISRVTGNADPVLAWKEHNRKLHEAQDFMNGQNFRSLIYQADGTNLTIDLPAGHIWCGGSEPSEAGVPFNANIPTEEVFTLPDKRGVNGTVSSTMPLNVNGQVIDRFSLTFKDGAVVDFKAEKGEAALKHVLDTDKGSRRLGEVALVPHRSPVSESGLVFYNTLFDENASCHLAFGKAYPTCLEGGSELDEAGLDQAGVNSSIAHVDFMVGSAHLNIDGVKQDGTKIPVFRNGAWALDFK